MQVPVYEFRPLPTFFRSKPRRFAGGKWIEDDGEYDLAFIGDGICLYYAPPHRLNILCSWLNGHWSGHERDHPGGNPWHYALKDEANSWGDLWSGRDSHPNERAGRAGMDKLCSERGGASGKHVEFYADDKIIAAGLLRERDTQKPFEWPRNMVCMYCGQSAPVGFHAEAVA